MCFCIFWVQFFVFFGFCCKRVVRPKQNRGNPLCILRVFVFFFSFKRTDEQGMCFVCFCVFSSDHRTHNQRPPCVFVFFLFINFYFVHNSDRGKHPMCFVCFCVFFHRSQVTTPMCFLCFCVFYQRLALSYFRPGQPPNVFYVFLCFSTKVSGHTTHVFRVFLCFFSSNVQFDPSSDRGSHPMCFMCFCVFHHRSKGKQPMCFVCFCVF